MIKRLYKMKRLIVIGLLLLGSYVYSQDWSGLGDGTGTNNTVIAMAEYQGDLIAAGRFLQAGGISVNRIARWDGSSWHAMGTGFDNEVRALAVFNGELYAAGIFSGDGPGTVPFAGMARWNGSQWNACPVPDPLTYDYRDLYVFNGQLYTTKHTMYTSFEVRVSRFDGTTWTDLPGTFTGPENYRYLYELGEFQGNLIAGGVFDSVNGTEAQRIAMFDGTQWVSLGFPVAGETGGILQGRVHAIIEYDGQLFAGGIFANFQDTIFGPSTASWDGTAWTAHAFDGNQGAVVYDFELFDDRLLAGGDFAYWEGTDIVSTCVMFDTASANHWTGLNFFNPLGASDLNGQEMAVLNGNLYIGGRFDYAGSSASPVHNVARFNGDLPTFLPDNLHQTTISVYPNPASDRVWLPGNLHDGYIGMPYQVVNSNGQEVLSGILESAGVGVGHLKPGLYILQAEASGKRLQARFIKE